MAKLDEQRNSARARAEEVLTQRKQQETERLANRQRDSRAQDDKTARLRALRLAKEAEQRTEPKAAARPVVKRAIKAT